MSGLSNEQLNHMDDHTLPHKYGIGFTNMVERTTPGSKDLSRWDNKRENGASLVLLKGINSCDYNFEYFLF